MKQIILLFSYVAFVAVANAQRVRPGSINMGPGQADAEIEVDSNEIDPPIDNMDINDIDPLPTNLTIVSNSTAPSESPISMPIDDETTSSPTASGPIPTPVPSPPMPEDCARQTCDPTDNNSCSCRASLECRQRGVDPFGVGTYICSQVPRGERNRISGSEGVGGAAGRDRSGGNQSRLRAR